jgi:hypothetical protein
MIRFDRSPLLFAALLALAPGCVSDIDTFRAQPGGPVVTYRAPGVDFSPFRTFAIVGRLALVTGEGTAPGGFLDAPATLGALVSALESRGYQLVSTVDPGNPPTAPVAADLSVNASALEPTDAQAADFWAASPEHLGPATWGVADATWSYPWSWVPLRVEAGTLLVEIADLRSSPTPGTLAVAWTFQAHGVKDAGGSYDTAAAAAAIDQAFAQSPYLAAGTVGP